jgi:O-antigen/teichoic acid export membrane protein
MTAQQSRNRIVSFALRKGFSEVILYFISTASLLLGIAAQLFGFIVLARFLGAEQFGKLMAITAATAIALSITGLGTEEVMLRRCIREPTLYPKLLGHSLILILISGSLLSFFALVGLHMLVHVPASPFRSIETLSIFAFSNIVLARCIMLTESIFVARQQIMYANIVVTGFAVARMLAAVIGCFVFDVNRLETWAIWHGGIHIVGTIACIGLLWRYGAPQWCVLRDEIWRGIHTTTPQLISNLRQNIDRIVLTAIVSPVTVGAYSVASNIVQYSFVTINSFSRLFYPRLAIAGVNGASATCQLAARYLVIIVGLGVANSLALFFIAPFLPWLFGKEFGESTHYLTVLCWLPILVAIHNIAYDALGAAERHGIRALFYNIIGLIGIGLIAGLTYFYGVNGTFAGIFIGYAFLCLAMWLCLIVLGRHEERARSNEL